MTSAAGFTLGYRPGLDGLRAVSVLAVLGRHSGWLSGGFLGVDVFFALSGFLITVLLTAEYARTGTLMLRLFYARRALRLLPAVVLMVAVCEVALLSTVPSEARPLVLKQGAAVLFYVANWAWMFDIPMGVFAHAWSLATEEQFYLIWPLVLIALLAGLRHRLAIIAVLLGGALGAGLYRFVRGRPGASVMHLYTGLDTHADPLILGCAAGLIVSWTGIAGATGVARAAIRGGGFVGLLALALLFARATFPLDYVRHHVSGMAALAGILIIIDLCIDGAWMARLFEHPALVGLGRISYGIYLWHFPVFYRFGAMSVRDEPTPLTTALPAWAATLAVAVASYYIVERPALALKERLAARCSYPSDPALA